MTYTHYNPTLLSRPPIPRISLKWLPHTVSPSINYTRKIDKSTVFYFPQGRSFEYHLCTYADYIGTTRH